MRNIFPIDILLTMYNTLILPHINYCLLSWGKSSDSIFLLQTRALRAICDSKYHAHTEPLFKLCNTLKVNDLYEVQLLTFYHKLKHFTISNNFNDFIPVCSHGSERYPIRNPKLLTPSYNHEYIKLTCRYQLPSLLNSYLIVHQNENAGHRASLSLVIKNVESIPLSLYKKIIKNNFISEYSNDCNIFNCYICQR